MEINVRLRAGAKASCAVLALSALALLSTPASAAGDPANPRATAAKVAVSTPDNDVETTSSVEDASLEPGCRRPRKRLWVDGEGWIIRRVTMCY